MVVTMLLWWAVIWQIQRILHWTHFMGKWFFNEKTSTISQERPQGPFYWLHAPLTSLKLLMHIFVFHSWSSINLHRYTYAHFGATFEPTRMKKSISAMLIQFHGKNNSSLIFSCNFLFVTVLSKNSPEPPLLVHPILSLTKVDISSKNWSWNTFSSEVDFLIRMSISECYISLIIQLIEYILVSLEQEFLSFYLGWPYFLAHLIPCIEGSQIDQLTENWKKEF